MPNTLWLTTNNGGSVVRELILSTVEFLAIMTFVATVLLWAGVAGGVL